jgi:hypothetical protein
MERLDLSPSATLIPAEVTYCGLKYFNPQAQTTFSKPDRRLIHGSDGSQFHLGFSVFHDRSIAHRWLGPRLASGSAHIIQQPRMRPSG